MVLELYWSSARWLTVVALAGLGGGLLIGWVSANRRRGRCWGSLGPR